jgi:pyridoxine 5-phosphate synthase
LENKNVKKMQEKTRLSVNINKIAVLRNSRGGNLPDLLQVAKEGITVHPRPDERHIRFADVYDLKKIVTTEYNIEGNPDEHWMRLVLDNHPAQATLVPDDPFQLTSDHGWDTWRDADFLKKTLDILRGANIRSSLFVDADIRMVEGAAKVGADRIEFYTGVYAKDFSKNKEQAIEAHVKAAERAVELGLGINAGHDLNLENLAYYKQNVVGLLEVSIGHALISDALYLGLNNTIQMYLRQLK